MACREYGHIIVTEITGIVSIDSILAIIKVASLILFYLTTYLRLQNYPKQLFEWSCDIVFLAAK